MGIRSQGRAGLPRRAWTALAPTILALTMLAATLAACGSGFGIDPVWFDVTNQTDVPIDVEYGLERAIRIADDVQPGQTVTIRRLGVAGCTSRPVAARDQSGRLIAWRPPQLCPGDVWRVVPDPVASP